MLFSFCSLSATLAVREAVQGSAVCAITRILPSKPSTSYLELFERSHCSSVAELVWKRGTRHEQPEDLGDEEKGRAKLVPSQVGAIYEHRNLRRLHISFQKKHCFSGERPRGRLLLHTSTSLRHPTVRAANLLTFKQPIRPCVDTVI